MIYCDFEFLESDTLSSGIIGHVLEKGYACEPIGTKFTIGQIQSIRIDSGVKQFKILIPLRRSNVRRALSNYPKMARLPVRPHFKPIWTPDRVWVHYVPNLYDSKRPEWVTRANLFPTEQPPQTRRRMSVNLLVRIASQFPMKLIRIREFAKTCALG